MNKETIPSFSVIGIAIRTTNENGQSGKDIPALWNRFLSEGISEKIPNKTSNTIYSVYTDYEKDETKPYTTILGCKVSTLENIPHSMTGKTFEEGRYTKRVAKGNINEGIVIAEWQKIWNSELPRTFIADFEVYGEKAQDPANAEVDIFIGIK